jgi:ankyrin repeat protein
MLLINKGADVNAKSEDDFGGFTQLIAAGSTPLHVVAVKGKPPVIELLLESGADPNAIDRRGYTPAEQAQGGARFSRLS